MMTSLWTEIIDPGRVFVLAEIGVNHNGDIELAKKMILAAREAGCDGVKFQAFSPAAAKIQNAPLAKYQKNAGQTSAMEMSKSYHLDSTDFAELQAFCKEIDLPFILTVFDEVTLDATADLDLELYKIGSGELVNIPLLAKIAAKGKPMIVSTGMANLAEVDLAVRTIENEGNTDLLLLHCASVYPARPADLNLRAMNSLARAFGYPVGFSDHSIGSLGASLAAAMGAVLIEKHFTTDRSLPGPDQSSSANPAQMAELTNAVKAARIMLGSGRKEPVPGELEMRTVSRKSVVTSAAIRAGDILSEDNLAIKKPGTGICPRYYQLLMGRTATRDLPAETIFSWDDVLGGTKEQDAS